MCGEPSYCFVLAFRFTSVVGTRAGGRGCGLRVDRAGLLGGLSCAGVCAFSPWSREYLRRPGGRSTALIRQSAFGLHRPAYHPPHQPRLQPQESRPIPQGLLRPCKWMSESASYVFLIEAQEMSAASAPDEASAFPHTISRRSTVT